MGDDEMNDYQKQADDFLKETNTTMKVEFLKYDVYFNGDKDKRDIYNITLKKGDRHYTFTFGQSINNSGWKVKLKTTGKITHTIPTNYYYEFQAISKKPSVKWWLNKKGLVRYKLADVDILEPPKEPDSYDVLACLEKYGVETFEEFCSKFGYDTDSRKAEKTYKAVKDQYLNICTLYNDEEMEKLREIS